MKRTHLKWLGYVGQAGVGLTINLPTSHAGERETTMLSQVRRTVSLLWLDRLLRVVADNLRRYLAELRRQNHARVRYRLVGCYRDAELGWVEEEQLSGLTDSLLH